MKTLLATIVLGLSLTAQARVELPVLLSVLTASITHMQIDPAFTIPTRISHGNVTIDRQKNTLALTLNRKWYCPPKAMCAMVMPAPMVIELPITSISVDSCGVATYLASKDYRPVDGDKKSLRVIDGSLSKCTNIMYSNSAELATQHFDRRNGKETNTYSRFSLSSFQEIMEAN